ncbi:hypothetical protein NLI96_g12279 [Meripilus lineatus]|uniref:Uncharacterized protein n=1 Tax=Meripilus lineatus TaxID=2056292 RepID=A0AAD5UQE2_9APHY|nr:hypothetical protein NLI96_g12279 [Physisporinus lineatus]
MLLNSSQANSIDDSQSSRRALMHPFTDPDDHVLRNAHRAGSINSLPEADINTVTPPEVSLEIPPRISPNRNDKRESPPFIKDRTITDPFPFMVPLPEEEKARRVKLIKKTLRHNPEIFMRGSIGKSPHLPVPITPISCEMSFTSSINHATPNLWSSKWAQFSKVITRRRGEEPISDFLKPIFIGVNSCVSLQDLGFGKITEVFAFNGETVIFLVEGPNVNTRLNIAFVSAPKNATSLSRKDEERYWREKEKLADYCRALDFIATL